MPDPFAHLQLDMFAPLDAFVPRDTGPAASMLEPGAGRWHCQSCSQWFNHRPIYERGVCPLCNEPSHVAYLPTYRAGGFEKARKGK